MKADFREVFEKNKKLVYHICLIHVKNPDDADDIVQEVFIKYIKSEDRFESDEHIRSWLVTVARNACVDKMRYWSRRGHFTDAELNEAIAGIYEDYPDGANDAMYDFFKLDETYGMILYLYYIRGYDTNEIADLLEMNVSTVKTRLIRGRDKMKNYLKEAGYDE